MSYDEEESEVPDGFRISDDGDDEPLDMPADLDFGEDEDPEDKYH